MAKFCGKCGIPLPGAFAFCPACGAPTAPEIPASPAMANPSQDVGPTAPYQATPQQAYIPPPQTPPQAYAPPQTQPQSQWSNPQSPAEGYPPPQPGKSGNSTIKIVLIVVVVLFLGAATVVGGLWYVGHQVVGKVKDAAAQAGISPDDLGHQGATIHGNPCRFLSKDDVGDAIGVPIIETQSTSDGCSYLAHGTMSDMTSKHLSAMMGQRGAPADTQKQIQQLAGGFFGAEQKPSEDSNPSGNAVVLAISIDENSARTQMKLNAKVLGGLGGDADSSTLTGIGDEAFVAADGMMMVRKGDTLIRLMYTSCPCSTEQIKPLAIKLAAAL